MELVDGVVTFLIGLVWLTRKVAKLSFGAASLVAKWLAARSAQPVPEPVVRTAAASSTSAAAAAPRTTAAASSRAPADATSQATKSRFEIADRNYLVKFGGGWSVTVRVYAQRGVAERLLRCTEPKMVEQLRYTFLRSVFPLKPVSLNEHTLEEVLRDCEVAGAEMAANLLRRLGDPQVEPLRARAEAAPVEAAPVAPAPTADVSPSVVAATPAKMAPRPAAGPGRQIQGRVVSAGKQPSMSGNGDNFEVVLETDGGEQEVKRGWHLSELFTQLKLSVGDNVVITDLGRKPIEPSKDGQNRFKTVYDVQRV